LRALVTGGAGFLGSHLVDALVARGDDVVVLDNLRRGQTAFLPLDRVRFIEADICDEQAVAEACVGVDTVFHLAAQSNVLGALQDMDYSFTTNVVGTFNVLKAATAAGATRLVFSSSREVYGEQTAIPVSEDAALTAKNPYGASKLAGEAYCRAWAAVGGLRCSVLRFGNLYGPRDSGRVIPLWLDRAVRGEPLEVFGGEQVLDFVPVDFAVAALLRAAETDLDGPVNVGTGKGTAILDLAERISQLAGGRTPVQLRPARGAEVVRFVAEITRMRRLLGLDPPADPLVGLPALFASFANTASFEAEDGRANPLEAVR
jgi:UDP-glucose 4-epimerase